MSTKAPEMICPKCGTKLDPTTDYHEGEDEGPGDVLHAYAEWVCPSCRHTTRDDEGEFKHVKNGVVVDRLPYPLEEALEVPVDWEKGGRVHNWRNHIGSATKEIWLTFNEQQKIALCKDAFESASYEPWD